MIDDSTTVARIFLSIRPQLFVSASVKRIVGS